MAELKTPWIQVFGTIAVHRPDGKPIRLSGSTKTLLAALVAAGRSGTHLEELARIYWEVDRPQSWEIALRSAISHLQAQLIPAWHISNHDGIVSLVEDTGWVDAWRLQEQGPFDSRPSWLAPGRPFGEIIGIAAVDIASDHLAELVPLLAPPSSSDADPAARLRDAASAVLLDDGDRHVDILRDSRGPDEVDTLVVGDRDLLVPLGPYSIAFPAVRNQIESSRGAIEDGAALKAWHIVSTDLSSRAASAPQRLIIDNTEQLDTVSLALTSFLIERRRSSDFSMVICAETRVRDVRLLDVIRRAQTAGARVVSLA